VNGAAQPSAVGEPGKSAKSGKSGAEWLSARERGTVLGIRAAFKLATLCGRTATKPLVAAIALFYVLFDRRVARASHS